MPKTDVIHEHTVCLLKSTSRYENTKSCMYITVRIYVCVPLSVGEARVLISWEQAFVCVFACRAPRGAACQALSPAPD